MYSNPDHWNYQLQLLQAVDGLEANTGFALGLAGGAITIAATATNILSNGNNREETEIKNMGSVTVYLGASGVSVANGFPLEPGEVINLKHTKAAIYGIVSAGTCAIRYYYNHVL